MRYKHLYVGRALAVLAEYFEMLGYDDAWLLQVAGEAARNWNWGLVREAIAAFMQEREFCGLEHEALEHITRIIANEEAHVYGGVYVELQEANEEEELEELPL
jgi:hypothetical protein